MRIDIEYTKQKMKIGQKWAWPSLFFKCWDPLISGTVEGTNLKFCTWIEGKGPDKPTEQNNAILAKRVVT